MATQIGAPSTPLTRPAPHFGAIRAAIVAVTLLAVIGAVAWIQPLSIRDTGAQRQSYGVGYPLRGGLAGPSRPQPALDLDGHYGAGYPLHGGLAGPSQPQPALDLGGHYGAGYPLHGGLAGPSNVNGED